MILLQKNSADSLLLAKARESQPVHDENKSSQCSETLRLIKPTAIAKHVFPNTSFALQLLSSWLEDSEIRGRCDGTNSSTEDVLARCGATPWKLSSRGSVVRQDSLLCCGGEPLRHQAFHHAGRVGS